MSSRPKSFFNIIFRLIIARVKLMKLQMRCHNFRKKTRIKNDFKIKNIKILYCL